MKNFADFLATIESTDNSHSLSWIEQWRRTNSPDWAKKKDQILSQELVMQFADDVSRLIVAFLDRVYSAPMYRMVLVNGLSFLERIHSSAVSAGAIEGESEKVHRLLRERVQEWQRQQGETKIGLRDYDELEMVLISFGLSNQTMAS